VISAQALNTLALRKDGTVVAWGDNYYGQCNVPPGLTNVTAIAAGGEHSLAVSNGFVLAWGDNYYGQCNVPLGLSNVWDVAASGFHSLALKGDGTVVAWGDNAYGEASVPAGLSNVVAVAAGGDSFIDDVYLGNALPYSLALKSDGSVVSWGAGYAVGPVGGLNQVISISGGLYHALAVRTGPPTAVITLEPTNQYQIAGGNVTFTNRGAGLYGVTYQWQTNGVNFSGATNATLTLTNVQAANQGVYSVVVTGNGGTGSIASSNASFVLVTPPVITSQSLPTNIITIYGKTVSFAATASAPGQNNGFPLSYQWRFNGTNISGANTNFYSFTANDNSSGTYALVVNNAAGSVSATWQVTVTNVIDVTQDLLLIYNTNSQDSTTVLNYYLAHRPMVSGANVLGIGCITNETITTSDFTNVFLPQFQSWATNNPNKHPQYLVLFLGIPSTVLDSDGLPHPSVQYQLSMATPGSQAFVTSINMNGTNDCIGYIKKLASIGGSNSPGQLIISASAGGYGNTNFVLDNVRHGPGTGDVDYTFDGNLVSGAIPAITNANIGAVIDYLDGIETSNALFLPHINIATNVAGYICWGVHSNWGTNYADGNYSLDGQVKWSGDSGWFLIRTEESYNGTRQGGQGTFLQWFSSNAFGGTNYSNTPVGAVSYVSEPLAPATDNAKYFGSWAYGKNFAICAWSSINIYSGYPPAFQMVGDPFVIR
jgi:hypothetical protein